MRKLLFIPLDYQYRPHEDWYNAFCKFYNCLHYSDQSEALAFRPDIVFVHSSALSIDKMLELKQICPFIIQWTGDCRENPLESVVAYKNISTITLLAVGLAQKEMYEKALNQPVFYLQHAIPESGFLPVREDLTDRKIVFIGNNHSGFPGALERTELCRILTEKFESFEVWGNGFNLPEFRNPDSILYSDSPSLNNRAYISIGAHCFTDKEGYYSMRALDIPAAGGCCLLRYVPNLEKIFTDGKHCLFYRSNEEAIEKIKVLMQDPTLRNQLAKEGQAEIRRHHTYEYRVFEINQIIQQYEDISRNSLSVRT